MRFSASHRPNIVSAIVAMAALAALTAPTAQAEVPNCPTGSGAGAGAAGGSLTNAGGVGARSGSVKVQAGHAGSVHKAHNASSPRATSAPLLPPLKTSGQFLVEADSGQLFVPHGVNAVYKCDPYFPDATQLTRADIRKMAQLGFNTVRLGVIWSGLEPCQVGTFGCAGYDEAYLDQVEQRVRQFNRYGIYVLIDFHQDLYSDAQNVRCLIIFTCDFHGEGAPKWATKNEDAWIGPPLYYAGLWGAEYFYPGVAKAFENLLEPQPTFPEVPQHYRDAWRHVADRFNGFPGVLGYDLLNEPSHGVLLPSEAQRLDIERLQPFFQSLIDAIREVDANHTIYYEPNVTNDFGPPFTMPAGYDPQDSAGNLGLSYHVYCIIPGFGLLCHGTQAATVQVKKQEMQQRGIAGYITEFGSSQDYDDTGYTADLADTHAQGWNYWQWKWWTDPTGSETEWVADESGVLDQDKAEQLARTYPRSIAADDPGTTGEEPTWCFTRHIHNPPTSQPSLCQNQAEGHFELTYNAVAPDTVTTVWVPVNAPLDEQHKVYPTGYRVTSLTGAEVVSEPDAPLLQIRSTTADEVHLELDPR